MNILEVVKQPIVTGVKKELYREYLFDDHIWKRNPHILLPGAFFTMFGTIFPSLLEFAQICVFMKSKYYIYHNNRGWVKYDTKETAKKSALNSFRGIKFGNWTFDDAFCDAFFEGKISLALPAIAGGKSESGTFSIGSCPDFDGYMSLPLCPKFVEVGGRRFVNKWKPSNIVGNPVHEKYGKELIWLIYRSLCAGDKLCDDINIEKERVSQSVLSGKYLNNNSFKWVMMWLAAQIQKPGINLLSNLWLLGELQGVGKGTLISVLNLIIGNHNVAKLNQTEIETGWSDHLLGASFVEIDELEPGAGKLNEKAALKFWESWIKSHTCSEFSNYTERNIGKHEGLINTSNFIFTTNNETPVAVSATDRRNCFIKTTNNPEFVDYAAAYNEVLLKYNPTECAEGFAAYLERIEIDYNFINTVFLTEIKSDIINSTKSTVEQWIEEDVTFEYGFHYSTLLFEKFQKWCSDCNEISGTQTDFGNKIKKLNPRLFLVEKGKCPTTRRITYTISENKNGGIKEQRSKVINNLKESLVDNETVKVVEDLDFKEEHVMAMAPKKSLAHIRAKLKEMSEEK